MSQGTIQQAFEAGLQHHQAGRLAEAEGIYRQILAQQPAHAGAVHQLGILAHEVGRDDAAVDLLRQAIACDPRHPQAHYNLGIILNALGRFDEAVAAFRQAVTLDPRILDAHIKLGNLLANRGQFDEAVAAYREAIAVRPGFAEAHNNLGNALTDKGQTEEAIAAYREAIALKPDYAEAYANLSVALRDHGQLEEAVTAARQAIALKANLAEAYINLGNALRDKGQVDGALAAYREAIALVPKNPTAHNNLGNALKDKGQLDEALAAYRQAIAVKPDYPDAYSNLGNALKDQGHCDAALAAYRQALAINPRYADAHLNLGVALRAMGQTDDAIAGFREAIALKPNWPEAYSNLGAALGDKRQLDESIACYQRALALKPGHPETHYNFALSCLLKGDLVRGFLEHEWRWKCADLARFARGFQQSQWDGSPLDGRTILLHAEQGIGDTLQFIRYLSLVRQRGGRVIVECQPEIVRLMEGTLGLERCVARGDALPAFDVHCPLLSLPQVLGTELGNIPAEVPYLFPDVQGVRVWSERMASDGAGVKVGLVWAGSSTHKNDRRRSLPDLSLLGPLGAVKNVSFYSLQKGAAALRTKLPPPGMHLTDWSEELHDFSDTASLLANLDLVISVDTAVAHLAGGMGRPAWVLLPFAPDWRWLLERTDSPWYPTVRLFRQLKIGDWEEPVRRLAEALGDLAVQSSLRSH